MGGASKAGLQLGGFSSTGVFVDGVLPGTEAEVKGQIQKGDQLLEVNGGKIGEFYISVIYTQSKFYFSKGIFKL